MILAALIAAILIDQFSLPGWYYALLGIVVAWDYSMGAFRDRRTLADIRELQQKLGKVEVEIERANLTLQVLNEESIEISSGVRAIEDRVRSVE